MGSAGAPLSCRRSVANPLQIRSSPVLSCRICSFCWSYCFRDKRRFQSKIAKFLHPLFVPPLKGLSLELDNDVRVKKTRMMELPGRERSLTESLAVWIRYTNMTERGTDGGTNRQFQTDTGRQQRHSLRIASGDKKKPPIIAKSAKRQNSIYSRQDVVHDVCCDMATFRRATSVSFCAAD